jgi:hypothetical protein
MDTAELALRLRGQLGEYRKFALGLQELLTSLVGQLDKTDELLRLASTGRGVTGSAPPARLPRPRPATKASGLCDSADGTCVGEVVVVKCDTAGCGWVKRLCESHGGASLAGRAKGGHQRLHRKEKGAATSAPHPFR